MIGSASRGAGEPQVELVDVGEALARLDQVNPLRLAGRVSEVTGLLVRATIPGVRVGELVYIDNAAGAPPSESPARLQAEVVGFRGEEVVLMPLGEAAGIGPDARGDADRAPALDRACGTGLLGRVLDGLGEPIDGAGPVARRRAGTGRSIARRPIRCRAPPHHAAAAAGRARHRRAADRRRGAAPRAVRRLGRRQVDAAGPDRAPDRRRRERDLPRAASAAARCGDFLDEALGPAARARSVVVCATSDAPSLVRLKSAFVATAIAEWFRDQGRRVLFMMDSLTRFARAQREVGLAAGEPPARQGYPPSVFALLPRLLERTGNGARGSITALYTVLVAGGDMDEPIADEVRGILDGHIVLSRELAARNHWPADRRAAVAVARDGPRSPMPRTAPPPRACASCWRPTSASAT